ncbi:MAG: VCBS repeat-containing protein [Proteobacteria bacterium]|nr:VCBS repeat-containing protein [Pseudomonadota bacterium]
MTHPDRLSGPVRRRRALTLAAAAPLVLLAGCWGDHGYNAPAIPPYEVSYGVAAADLNGDGQVDVAGLSTVHPVQTMGSSNLKVYLGSGGTFGTPTLVPAGTDPLWVEAADVNGDGAVDLVTASYDDGTVSVFPGSMSARGTFGAPIVLTSPGASQLAIADVSGDGLADIVSADFNVSLFVQSSPGVFAAPIPLYGGGANFVAVGDLNGDGLADIALTDAGGVKLLMQTTSAPGAALSFGQPIVLFQQTPNQNLAGANLIAIADVDGDGLNDLVITDPGPTGGGAPTVNVLIQNPAAKGTFLPAVSYPIVQQDVSVSIKLVDLTGTGGRDIVIGAYNHVTVLLHDPAHPGKYLPAAVYPAGGAYEIAIADVNGDGRPDIVVANGVTQPVVNGVTTTRAGVLLQSATTPGTFAALADLP